jgi:hypothetical protein
MSAFPSVADQQVNTQFNVSTWPVDVDTGVQGRTFLRSHMSAPVIPGSSALADIATITVRDRPITIQGVVSGGGALTHVSLFVRTEDGAPWTLLAADADFSTPTTVPNDIIKAASNSLSTTASGSNFILTLAMPGVYQYKIQAQGSTSATSLQLWVGVGTNC